MNGDADAGLPLHYMHDNNTLGSESVPLRGVQVMNGTTSTSALSNGRRRGTPMSETEAAKPGQAEQEDVDDEKKRDVYGEVDDERALHSNNLSKAAFGSLSSAPFNSAKPNKWESLVPDGKRRTGKPASIGQAIVRPL